ncbi:hypothetical protein [Argonema galeatum]|uniref:hypothetical protein n=1 Tax=Argonema galeatum TaxID=2942762 RepID=UPI00201358F3|nr:hypothetical protein [Argonema galeatum]MCL1464925.1 hypothetical protein [Argonema galeatum A003/A1]
MSAKVSKRLVIYASVARAAGSEDAKDPKSQNCRDFLKAVRNICHRIVMTPDIKEEWNKHQSIFASRWRSSMVAKKKLEYLSEIVVDDELWSQVEDFTEFDNQRSAMIKDLLLIEAALATDKIVISLDDRVRKFFAKAAEQVNELKDIVWVNPARPEEQALLWLENGAEPEIERQLGFRPEESC